MAEEEALSEAQKAIDMVHQLRALERYAKNLSLTDYKNAAHSSYILKEVASIMRYMFEQQYKTQDLSVNHALDLSFINQVENLQMPPDKLKFFVNNKVPEYRKQLEMRMLIALLRPDSYNANQTDNGSTNSILN